MKLLTADLGSEYAGLSTVQYQVKDADSNIEIAWTSEGVSEVGNGFYQTTVDLAEGFVGTIQWRATDGGDALAGEDFEVRTVQGIADAWLDRADAIETGITPRQAIRGLVAMLFGQVANAGTDTETFKNPSGGTTRLTISVDNNGNRSSITLNL